jgi:hypothetical protein
MEEVPLGHAAHVCNPACPMKPYLPRAQGVHGPPRAPVSPRLHVHMLSAVLLEIEDEFAGHALHTCEVLLAVRAE